MKKIVTISELGIIITGNTPPRSNPKLYGNYTPFIKATDISETEKYTYHPEEYYSEEGYNKYIKSLIPKGSTCVVTIGSIGKKMTMAHCDLFINQAMNAIIPNENFDNEYVYYAVKNILPNIKMLDSGTASGRENVSKSAFSKMQILIEDNIITQRRIAEILSRYDSLIENYQKQINLLEESAQRLYKEWFVDLRFPGHENTKIVDGVPEGWEKICLGELVCFKRGKIITKKEIIEGNIPVVAGGTEPAYYCNKSNTGNRVITISASGANAGYTRMYFEKIWASDCSFIDCYMTNYFHFVYCYLIANKIAIDNLQKGAAQPHVYPKDINALALCCPHNDILDSFEPKISYYFDLISLLQKQIHKLFEARDRLLPKLMNGEFL
ncbi:restriction endonuclease subunit S [Phocaeicola massiliensis]|jgi:type I restriction enzyme S subunit|uniref:restriction endonuclease subunit S n=1 Tax=Phocaeicola massiliensis TaxID=204516 RepID=UPI001E29FA02|nr:restriction endonuclease subunit S [Phocaeicola massiliensis]